MEEIDVDGIFLSVLRKTAIPDKGCPLVLVNRGVGGGVTREDVVSRENLTVSLRLGYGILIWD
jgi:hypothetical protein